MIKDAHYWHNWEKKYLKNHPADLEQNLRLLQAMYERWRSVHPHPSKVELRDLDLKIKIARAIHVSKAA